MNTTDTSVETAHEMPEGDSADNDVFVLGTNVSWAYLEERLRRALGTNAKFGSNRRIESIGVGQVHFQENFLLSLLFHLLLKIKIKSNAECAVFLKKNL